MLRLLILGLSIQAIVPACGDEDELLRGCRVGVECGPACIPTDQVCDEEAVAAQCVGMSPCCIIGKRCGEACISTEYDCRNGQAAPPSNCHTTSNCGCSGYRKDECGGACCQWVVGSGCRGLTTIRPFCARVPQRVNDSSGAAKRLSGSGAEWSSDRRANFSPDALFHATPPTGAPITPADSHTGGAHDPAGPGHPGP